MTGTWETNPWLTFFGPLLFGLVVGWITYRTLRYYKSTGINDIATVVAAVGGAGVTAVIGTDHAAFYPYCIGLAIGFFAYAYVAIVKLPDAPLLVARSMQLEQQPPK